ncbi:MAG: hypothetical protein JW746_10085 [Candidatus Krumholzibacteriota bacterium]|nr:hypothetical protein [Candidatus Krumholzibacteriota bacterium]
MVKNTAVVVLTVLISLFSCSAEAGDSRYFFQITGGVGQSILKNLSDELSTQDQDGIPLGFSAAVSLGRSLMDGKWSIEAQMNLTRYPAFSYANEFQEFNGPLLHFGYSIVFKRCLRPGKETFVPRIGVGLGFSKTELSAGKGMLDGPEAIILLQVDHRIKTHIDLVAEAVWIPLIREEIYRSPFSVQSDYDGILDSNEKRLSDGYSSVEFRLGIKVRLKPPKQY